MSSNDPTHELPLGHGELILIVDDEESIRETAGRLLEHYGYKVLTSTDGTQAVAACIEHLGAIHLMITDMKMPHLDGAKTIQTLRKVSPKMKIIAMSGYLPTPSPAGVQALQAEAYLSKPFSKEMLLQTVRNVLGKP